MEGREKTLVENFTIIHQHIISSLSHFSSKPLLTTTQSTEQHMYVLKKYQRVCKHTKSKNYAFLMINEANILNQINSINTSTVINL